MKKILVFTLFILASYLVYLFGINKITLEDKNVSLASEKQLVILTPHEHPRTGDTWKISFKTKGKNNLFIIPQSESTINDLKNPKLYCGDKEIKPKILKDDILFMENWGCNTTARLENYIQKQGKHTFKFQFGSEYDFAYNTIADWNQLAPGNNSGLRMGSTAALSVTYGNGTFVVVGDFGKASYSSDGINWTALTAGDSTGIKFGTTLARSVTYGNGTFVVVGESGKASYSSDGINWTALTAGDSTGIKFGTGTIAVSVTYGNGTFVVVGQSGKASYSSDGINWTALTAGVSTGIKFDTTQARSVTYGNGTFVVVGDLGVASYALMNSNPSSPSSLGGYVSGAYISDSTPTLTFTLSDTDSSDTLKYEILLDDNSDFSSPVVDYTSALDSQGATSFAVGQAVGSGSYVVGSANQTLTDGSYYWKVKAIDNSNAESSYVSANSGSVAFIVDTGIPNLSNNGSRVNFDLDSPADSSYMANDRPVFRWRGAVDSYSGVSKYRLNIDNPSVGSGQVTGDFTINDIPASRTTDYETDKYIAKYENFSDRDDTNNYISLYTKSSSSWLDSENDGKLREGIVSWKVTAVDGVGNEASSQRKLFVDRTAPEVEISSINNLSHLEEDETSGGTFTTSDTTPLIIGGIDDYLSGVDKSTTQNENGPMVSSGADSVNIKMERLKGLNYELYETYLINADELTFSCNNQKISDNTKQNCGKYFDFIFKAREALPLGTYKFTFTGKDKAGNSGSNSLTLVIAPSKTVAKIIEKKQEVEKKEDVGDIKKPKEEVPISTVRLDSEPAQASITQTMGDIKDQVANAFSKTEEIVFNSIAANIKGVGDNISSVLSIAGNIGGRVAGVYEIASSNVPRFGKGTIDKLNKNVASVVDKSKEEIDVIGSSISNSSKSVTDAAGNSIVNVGYRFVSQQTVITDVKVDTISPTSVKITWKTNQATNGKVNYGLDETYPLDVQSEERTKDHEFILKNLKPDTEYHFEVMSQGKNYVYDANRRFRTPGIVD